MKKIAFILLLFCGFCSQAQQFVLVDKLSDKKDSKKEAKISVFSEEEYSKLLNYTPKSFIQNLKTKPDNRVLDGDLNSISSLELRYAYQEQLKLNPDEIQWLEGEIRSLAAAFFKERKLITIEQPGSQGCREKGITTERKKRFNLISFKFCYTNAAATAAEDQFMAVFNNQMQQLWAAKYKK